eukprot:310498-Prymnesium_polylepis.1
MLVHHEWHGLNKAEKAVLLARLRVVALETGHDPDTEPLRNAQLHGTSAEEVMRDQDRRWKQGSTGAATEGAGAGGGDGGGINGLPEDLQEADT